MTRPFTIDLGWAAILDNLGIRAADLLRSARLPEDLFTRPRPALEVDEFVRLWEALSSVLKTDTPGLELGKSISVEAFSPPLFAAFCSPNLTVAAERLAKYKPLIGPMVLESHPTLGGLELTYGTEEGVALPNEFLVAELVFLVQLARLATRRNVRPIAVEMVSPPDHQAYQKFFGHRMLRGPFNRVVFSPDDAKRPFLSANPAMFAAFEPDLQTRLDQLARTASYTDRLRSVLMEALPAGQADMENVSKRLGVSKRSLQRKLGAEETSFQTELQSLRERLARRYLGDTTNSSAEISFLLGYEDPNSFIRAFHVWTGTTPEALRQRAA